MIYNIKGGAPKDILIGDFVELEEGVMDPNTDGSDEYQVAGFDSAGTLIQILFQGQPTWLTASQIKHVWRLL